jgi:uncharacterized protein YxjI
MTHPPPPPGWYPDPAGGSGIRWWDGISWTEHVQQPATPPFSGAAGGSSPAGRSVLLEQPVLVVHQRRKLIELTNEYGLFDGEGQQLGTVVEVGQSTVRKAVRLVSRLDHHLTHRLEVRDDTGPLLLLTRPAMIRRSRVLLTRPDGQLVGEIVQVNVFGRIRFDLVVGGRPVGAIRAENWRAWDFAISDASGREVARITKTWEGFARTIFTTADSYVLRVHQRLEDPLASLVLAAALTVDTALKQAERGGN